MEKTGWRRHGENRLKKTWRKQVEEDMEKTGWRRHGENRLKKTWRKQAEEDMEKTGWRRHGENRLKKTWRKQAEEDMEKTGWRRHGENRLKKTWRKQVEEDMEKTGWRRKCNNWFEKGRCTWSIEVECWRKSVCCWVAVNLATLSCWGYYQIAAGLLWIWPPSLVGDTTRLLLGCCESGHPLLLGILPDCCWVAVNQVTPTSWGYYHIAAGLLWIWPPSLVGDTTRLLLGCCESGHPLLLGILPDCCWVAVNLATLSCWGYYQITAGLLWIWPPSLVGDTTRLLLGCCESGHPLLLGILPDYCWVAVNLATLSCWGYYQIAAGLLWIWPPPLVGGTTILLLGCCESGHPLLLGILPDCCWVAVNLATLSCWGYYQITAGLLWIWPPSLVGDTTRLLLGCCESGHPLLLGILPDFAHWCLSHKNKMYIMLLLFINNSIKLESLLDINVFDHLNWINGISKTPPLLQPISRHHYYFSPFQDTTITSAHFKTPPLLQPISRHHHYFSQLQDTTITSAHFKTPLLLQPITERDTNV